MSKVLVVEDDVNIAESIQELLGKVGLTVDLAHSSEDAEALLFVSIYALIVLDWELPGKSGVDLLREIRATGIHAPVLMLTGRGTVDDKETGFEKGADDYLVKPFNSRELVARVKALMRRQPLIESDEIRIGEFVLDVKGRRLLRVGEQIALTKQEYALLDLMMRNKNEVFSAEAIMERAWSGWSDCSPDAVRVHITRLRKKMGIDAADSPIKTVHRQGYMFVSD